MTANPGGLIVILDVGFILYYVVIVSVCPRPGPGVGPQYLQYQHFVIKVNIPIELLCVF